MVKIIVLWKRPEDPAAFEEHYAKTYLPIARQVPGVRLVELSTVVESPLAGEAPYHRVGEAWFGSLEEAHASLGSPEGQAWTAAIESFPGSRAEMIVTDTELGSDAADQPA